MSDRERRVNPSPDARGGHQSHVPVLITVANVFEVPEELPTVGILCKARLFRPDECDMGSIHASNLVTASPSPSVRGLEDRESGGSSCFAPISFHKSVRKDVKSRPEVIDHVSNDDTAVRGDCLRLFSNPKDVLPSVRVELSGDTVGINFEERLDQMVKVFEMFPRPCNFQINAIKDIHRVYSLH